MPKRGSWGCCVFAAQGALWGASEPNMAASGAAIGSLLGLGVQLYANAVRKLPLMRNPWEHAIAIGLGGYAGKWLVEFEERTALELEEILQKRAQVRTVEDLRRTIAAAQRHAALGRLPAPFIMAAMLVLRA